MSAHIPYPPHGRFANVRDAISNDFDGLKAEVRAAKRAVKIAAACTWNADAPIAARKALHECAGALKEAQKYVDSARDALKTYAKWKTWKKAQRSAAAAPK